MTKGSIPPCLFHVVCLFFCLPLFAQRNQTEAKKEKVGNPPRGWNSYDSFTWTISEEQFLQNAEIVSQKLLSYGYQYVVVDYLWYRRKVKGADTNSVGLDMIDEWGRVIPDPERWPSSKDGKGFTEVAQKVHSLGLKFGIHVMRGISMQAVNANTPILNTSTGLGYKESGRMWHAKDIGMTKRVCSWMKDGFMSVDTKFGAAKAFLKSLYLQYAEWGVDFVKHDCVFGDDFDINEIVIVSEILEELDHRILYSISPGTSATPAMAKEVSSLVNMYRITRDDWDSWHDVTSHFDVARNFAAANMIGAEGLKGHSWPDLDMLPLGWVTDPGSNEGPHRKSNLNLDEQRTQMTLWSMARSPLILGGDMRKLDNTTYNIIINPTLLEIDSFSANNNEFPYITGKTDLRSGHLGFTQKVTNPKEMNGSNSHYLHLTSCEDHEAKGWISEVLDNDLERVCWKNMGGRYTPQFCLYKRKHSSTLEGKMIYKHKYLGMFRSESDSMEMCLDASSIRKSISQERNSSSYSPCRWDPNQMWEVNNATLVNSHSGLCGVLKSVRASVSSNDIRSWVATGKRGNIYVAFFNLSPQNMVMSAKISDLDRVLPIRKLKRGSCTYRESWTGKDYGVADTTISSTVAMHGCALFVLKCSNVTCISRNDAIPKRVSLMLYFHVFIIFIFF